jgi:AcrR family transcriptional regulator
MTARDRSPFRVDRHQQAEETREELLRAAVRLFSRNGYHATSVQQITAAANVSKGAFYYHFETKDDVLIAVHEMFIDSELRATRQIVERGLPAPKTLALLMEELAASFDTYASEITIFFRERHYLSGPAFRSIRRKRDEVEKMIVDVIERGVQDGEFKPVVSARLAAFGAIAMGAWLHQWYVPGGSMTAREVGRMYASMLIEGLAT